MNIFIKYFYENPVPNIFIISMILVFGSIFRVVHGEISGYILVVILTIIYILMVYFKDWILEEEPHKIEKRVKRYDNI